jgi:hypothetical protein
VPVPAVKRVPWAEARGADRHEYEVRGQEEVGTGLGEQSLRDNLKNLGYLE